ncbi:hypothetical protein SAMN05428989_2401 [Pseudoxanthomonas sp. GM95]|uniref:hypothetical protein n=1 Tax=Pseudoxanthomonas sp. GM95 TaxID=1881043 RepID=UPI0008AE36BC|nr:hypothetical protein [Pseudoxanthomonas sp. GM95]SEL74706.1 hypothetical protein SAMN05428989_2401 [Pseudoxanthomonas sp. GM95]
MKHLAQCVVRYAQCLWQAQPLLPLESGAAAPASSERLRRAAQLADHYLASLLGSLAALPADQRATLTQAARMGLRPVLASQHKPDAVRDALIAGEPLVPPQAPATPVAPWRDEALAAIALRSLQYALDLSDALPDPHAATPMTGLSNEQHAALWTAAHAIDEQQAALWDAMEAVSTAEADLLAAAARDAVQHVLPDHPHAELLAYFASGMFAERVCAKG